MKLVPDDANILVCTDFDELFDPGWAKILRDNWIDQVTRVFYLYAWSHLESGEPTDTFKYDKIHTRDYYWKYPVHEVLWRDDIENQVVLDVGDLIFLHHFQDQTKPRDSYLDLLKLSVEENPDDCHVRNLYAREYLLAQNYERAIEEYLGILEMKNITDKQYRYERLDSVCRVSDIYAILEKFDDAIHYANEFIKLDPTYREPYLTLAKVYNLLNMPNMAELMINYCLENCTKKRTE